MKKITEQGNITLNIFKKVTSLHIKTSMKKNTFMALANSKMKIFSKFKKQMVN
jgi:hypothetical protein